MVKNDGFAIMKNILNYNLVIIIPIFKYIVNSGAFLTRYKISNLKCF
jgi:hypothetical protein